VSADADTPSPPLPSTDYEDGSPCRC
jgi:hypothetical protein